MYKLKKCSTNVLMWPYRKDEQLTTKQVELPIIKTDETADDCCYFLLNILNIS